MMSEIMHFKPFVLSLSKDSNRQQPHFDKRKASGSIQGKLIP